MNQRAKLRPWQFSLRFLLAVTALVAVGAAFFGWRERQLGPQRRAVARIVELGGSVEMERRGSIEAIKQGCDTGTVVAVTLRGHLTGEALQDLKSLPALRRRCMTYSRFEERPLARSLGMEYEPTHHQLLAGSVEFARFIRVKNQLPFVDIGVSCDGLVVPLDTAFAENLSAR